MDIKTYKVYFIACGLALIVNLILFALLPNLVKSKPCKTDLETVVSVNFVKFAPKEPKSEKKESPPEKKPTEKVIPLVSLRQKAQHNPAIKMDIPDISFKINPKLATGMPVAPPGDDFKFKDFYEQGDVDQMPTAIFKTEPLYPYRARRLNINGKVDVKFLVNEQGFVSDIKILRSTPPGVFDKSVLTSLSLWKFSPGKVDGRSVSTWVVTTIEFKLEGA